MKFTVENTKTKITATGTIGVLNQKLRYPAKLKATVDMAIKLDNTTSQPTAKAIFSLPKASLAKTNSPLLLGNRDESSA